MAGISLRLNITFNGFSKLSQRDGCTDAAPVGASGLRSAAQRRARA